MRKLLITISSLVVVALVCLGAASINYNTYMNNAIVYTNVMAKTATITNGITAGVFTTTTNNAANKIVLSSTTGNPTNGLPYNILQYAGANADGTFNEVLGIGHNLAPGGGLQNTSFPAWGYILESNWQNGTNHYAELNFLLVDTNSYQFRPFGMAMNLNNTNDWQAGFQAVNFNLLYPNATPWYQASPTRLSWSPIGFTNKTVEWYADESVTPHGFFFRALTNGLASSETLYLNSSAGWGTVYVPGGYAQAATWGVPGGTLETATWTKNVTGGNIALASYSGLFPRLQITTTNAGNSTATIDFLKNSTWMWSIGTDLNNNNTADIWFYDRGSSHLAMYIAPTTRRVEINGTGNPSEQLDVTGNIKASGNVIGGGFVAGTAVGITTTWTNMIPGIITQRISAVNGIICTNLTL